MWASIDLATIPAHSVEQIIGFPEYNHDYDYNYEIDLFGHIIKKSQ